MRRNLAAAFALLSCLFAACVSTEAVSGADATDSARDTGGGGRDIPEFDTDDEDAVDAVADVVDVDAADGSGDTSDVAEGSDASADVETGVDAGPTPCDGVLDCEADQSCIDGVCIDRICVPDGRTCLDRATLRDCDSTGTAPNDIVCADRTGCTEETCYCDGTGCARVEACTPLQRRCDVELIELCLSSGERWVTIDVCDPDAGQSCLDGVCVCSDPLRECAGKCTDLLTDEQNCGECGTNCGEGNACVAGECVCNEGTEECGDGCVDVLTDTDNCGSCDFTCGAGQTCSGGQCLCEGGGVACGSDCVDTTSDEANCGECGTVCGSSQTCVGGDCTCFGGQTACGASCVLTGSDENNCGRCGNICGAGQTCQTGTCACSGATELCGGSCVNTATDEANCGRCGATCDGTCVDGICELPACDCPAPLFTYCAPSILCDAPNGCCPPIFPGCLAGNDFPCP
jgi:hypothetical protein